MEMTEQDKQTNYANYLDAYGYELLAGTNKKPLTFDEFIESLEADRR